MSTLIGSIAQSGVGASAGVLVKPLLPGFVLTIATTVTGTATYNVQVSFSPIVNGVPVDGAWQTTATFASATANQTASINNANITAVRVVVASGTGTVALTLSYVALADSAGNATGVPGPNTTPQSIGPAATVIGQDDASGNPLILINGSATAVPQLQLPRLRYAMTQMQAGVRNVKIACAGDSTTAGQYADGTQYGNAASLGYPAKLCAALSARYPVYGPQLCACGVGAANIAAADPRVTLGTNWTATVATFGGAIFANTTGASTSILSFAPGWQFDTIDVYYLQQAAQDTFTIGVDGGAALGATVVATGASTVAKVTRTCALGTHTININKGGTNSLFILAISAYNSAVKGIEIFNAGYSGTTTTTWVSTSAFYSPGQGAATGPAAILGFDLIDFMIGINNWATAISPATTTSDLQTILAAWQLYSDVLIMTPFPSSSSATALATQLAIVQAIREVAQQGGAPLIDQNAMYGSYALAQGSLGYYLPANNTVHPGAGGYQAAANLVASTLGI